MRFPASLRSKRLAKIVSRDNRAGEPLRVQVNGIAHAIEKSKTRMFAAGLCGSRELISPGCALNLIRFQPRERLATA